MLFYRWKRFVSPLTRIVALGNSRQEFMKPFNLLCHKHVKPQIWTLRGRLFRARCIFPRWLHSGCKLSDICLCEPINLNTWRDISFKEHHEFCCSYFSVQWCFCNLFTEMAGALNQMAIPARFMIYNIKISQITTMTQDTAGKTTLSFLRDDCIVYLSLMAQESHISQGPHAWHCEHHRSGLRRPIWCYTNTRCRKGRWQVQWSHCLWATGW